MLGQGDPTVPSQVCQRTPHWIFASRQASEGVFHGGSEKRAEFPKATGLAGGRARREPGGPWNGKNRGLAVNPLRSDSGSVPGELGPVTRLALRVFG